MQGTPTINPGLEEAELTFYTVQELRRVCNIFVGIAYLDGMSATAGWINFYVIVGSSAGALIGLQFVVITLLADLPIAPTGEQASSAFGTPTVVHLGAVLLLSAVLSIPWRGIRAAAVLWGLVGLTGIVYEIIVLRRMRAQTAYTPVFEDWMFHFLLPFAAYATLAASAYAARSHGGEALFGVGAAVLLLLFIGIHNAWDAASYHVFAVSRRRQREAEHKPTE
jgi:hypothetical protein